MVGKFNPYAKAIVGAILAGLGAAATALASPGINANEWVIIAMAVVSTFGMVWSTDNKPAGTSGIAETQLTITSSTTEPVTPSTLDVPTGPAPVYETGRARTGGY